MNAPEYLSVRFHFRGQFEYIGKEWLYKGGRTGMSTVHMLKLPLPELKRHLADHVSFSTDFLEKTALCWKDKEFRAALMRLEDQAIVMYMAKYATDADVMDLYARHPIEEEFEDHVMEEMQIVER
uniref:Uncharacterized protein n=1 Tax=Avena sativa TaxID=4498 RepID=A0ACD5W8H8_AVESA